jgi:8-oxo-dGTP pyrophosphatase MutT (NUDIX family)
VDASYPICRAALPAARRRDHRNHAYHLSRYRPLAHPQGLARARLSPPETAAHEAREEGGLVGRIDDRSIGSYHYDKRLPDGSTVHCVVEVFALDHAAE